MQIPVKNSSPTVVNLSVLERVVGEVVDNRRGDDSWRESDWF